MCSYLPATGTIHLATLRFQMRKLVAIKAIMITFLVHNSCLARKKKKIEAEEVDEILSKEKRRG